MHIVRSILFHMSFYAFSVFMMIICMPHMFLLPRKYGKSTVDAWCKGNMWLAKFFCGIHVEVRGRENIPEGGFLVASKHQSSWETFGLIPIFKDPAYILKRELMWLPLLGWYIAKLKMIPIDRGDAKKSIQKMVKKTGEAMEHGRQIIVFPEGTRRPVGAEPAYRPGIIKLYRDLDHKVVPVALNSGMVWPRRSLVLNPGTLIVEILPAIEPGLAKREFFHKLQDVIETATNKILAETENSGYSIKSSVED